MGTQVPVGTGMFSVLHKFDNTDGLAVNKKLLDEVEGPKQKDKSKGKGKEKGTEAAAGRGSFLLSPKEGKTFTPVSPADILK